jgi:hypothetical protein
MNINLREVICTSRDGDRFWRMPEVYIRGSTIKYLRIPDEVHTYALDGRFLTGFNAYRKIKCLHRAGSVGTKFLPCPIL